MERKDEKSRPTVEFTPDKVVVHEGVRYAAPIDPHSSHHLDRSITMHDRSRVDGNIFGRKVEIGVECEVMGSIFCQDWLTVGFGTRVHGNIICQGPIVLEEGTTVGDDHQGTIIAMEVRLAKKCTVKGNIIAFKSIDIADECVVLGVVSCIGGPLKIGKSTAARDVLSAGAMTLGAGTKLLDSAVWSRTMVEGSGIDLDGQRPVEGHKRKWQGDEINLNANRMKASEASPLKVDERHHKAVRDILTHRAQR